MCGFVAIVEPGAIGPPSSEVLERMLATIRHRGPDDQGTYGRAGVAFGFRRLSILDLSPSGHQPMSIADGAVTIVFNGEIYNYLELRRELRARGHQFRSTGDTEVLLAAYLEWGTACLNRLNGMWAFVLHDARTGRVFGARDRFGMKPLYRCAVKGAMLFASEIKAILASGCAARAPDLDTVAAFLAEGRLDESDRTFHAGVFRVPAASGFTLESDGRYAEWRYWRVGDAPCAEGDMEDVPEKFAALFEDAVRLHMRSDVPVGIHLSGGLDSTSIACASARVRTANDAQPLAVFSYMPPEFGETPYIRETVRATQARLIELSTDAQRLWSDLEAMLHFQDEPVHTMTALVSFQLMRATAEHGIKVILNGQGADEVLAGYPNFFRHHWHDLALSKGSAALRGEIAAFAAAHARSPGPLEREVRVRRLLRSLNRVGLWRALMARRRRARLAHGWYAPELVDRLPGERDVAPADLTGALAYAQTVTPLPLYLRLEDRNAMAHSIEARLPFLDHRLVEFAHALPGRWKLSGPWNKFVLREAMRGRIPESVRTRVDKMGFPVPAHRWFRDQLFEPVMDLLHRSAQGGWVRKDAVERDVARYRAGEIDITDALFDLAQFEVWLAAGAAGPRQGAPEPASRAALAIG